MVKFVLVAEAFAVATYALGWWAVPLVALVCGLVIRPEGSPVLFPTVGASAGWLTLLLIDAARGPLGEVATRFGGVVGFPPVALVVITLLFPALLAWSAAFIGAETRRKMLPRSEVAFADA